MRCVEPALRRHFELRMLQPQVRERRTADDTGDNRSKRLGVRYRARHDIEHADEREYRDAQPNPSGLDALATKAAPQSPDNPPDHQSSEQDRRDDLRIHRWSRLLKSGGRRMRGAALPSQRMLPAGRLCQGTLPFLRLLRMRWTLCTESSMTPHTMLDSRRCASAVSSPRPSHMKTPRRIR